MLDTTTKSRIDSARDILVGKVPDPKSQVEQITIALIYKFMDEMDRQSEEMGGKPSFFVGEFKKYRWSQLLDKRLGGSERLTLYAEGIEKMNENAAIPQLFRTIFKGVFLPYRDPETLNLFLKEIDGFSYDHSECLGDAYEYLLSVLGTQGKAGQFRTPRHIIDFIVAIVNPGKNDTILDPACGTAGFLISSFKHVLKTNNELSPDERGRLMKNFVGYDIAPDMCRLSRANMYLHGFPNPTIHEYDTLTSEDRWDERYDIVMANPPFMSPKGGIRPHSKFTVKAKRSEVLFVDYIAEHLTPGGRAGIIVPEGIIFQSQKAYVKLRRMLVENCLWAVVSLPAGVFNPYAGVKTSILFLDRDMARRTEDILFVKISNDGFDLGAQRRPVPGNELPEALKSLTSYDTGKRSRKHKMLLSVNRQHVLRGRDCNLSGDRYRSIEKEMIPQWPMLKLGTFCSVIAGQSPPGHSYNEANKGMPFHQGKSEFNATYLGPALKWTTAPSRTAQPNDIVMSVRAPVGPVNIVTEDICIGRGLAVIRPNNDVVLYHYLFLILDGMRDRILGSHGTTFSSISRSEIQEIQIPLPPLEEQEKLVAELDGYRKVIEGARQVVENYKPSFQIDPAWPVKPLGELITEKPKNGYSGKPVKHPTCIKVLSLSATTNGELDCAQFKYLDEEIPTDSPVRCRKGDILLQRGNTKELVGTAALFDIDGGDYIYPDLMIRVRANETLVLSEYLVRALQSPDARSFIINHASGSAGSMPKINQQIVKEIPIPVPPLETQHEIVKALRQETTTLKSLRLLISTFEAKIQNRLSQLWGEASQ